MKDQCIEHTQKGPHGHTMWGGRGIKLHRKVFCQHRGLHRDDIEGLVVRHRCDNPRCINPAHLELGTHWDNVQDRVTRGRSADTRGEKHPSVKLTEEQVHRIRQEYTPRLVTYADLGRKYGVHPTNIVRIVKRKSWSHV